MNLTELRVITMLGPINCTSPEHWHEPNALYVPPSHLYVFVPMTAFMVDPGVCTVVLLAVQREAVNAPICNNEWGPMFTTCLLPCPVSHLTADFLSLSWRLTPRICKVKLTF